MIAPWNRRQLITTVSLEQQSRVSDILSHHRIPYRKSYPTGSSGIGGGRGIGGGSRGRNYISTLNACVDLTCPYVFYVHKKDYARAHALVYGRVKD